MEQDETDKAYKDAGETKPIVLIPMEKHAVVMNSFKAIDDQYRGDADVYLIVIGKDDSKAFLGHVERDKHKLIKAIEKM